MNMGELFIHFLVFSSFSFSEGFEIFNGELFYLHDFLFKNIFIVFKTMANGSLFIIFFFSVCLLFIYRKCCKLILYPATLLKLTASEQLRKWVIKKLRVGDFFVRYTFDRRVIFEIHIKTKNKVTSIYACRKSLLAIHLIQKDCCLEHTMN